MTSTTDRFAVVGAFACLTVICMLAASLGALPVRLFGGDTFFLLDNAWRVINDQKVHVDYFSPWGPLTFLVAALGLELSHRTVDGLAYANALFGFAAGLWGIALCRHRFSPALLVAMVCFLSLLVVSPYALGWNFWRTTHAMGYNRYAYALLALIIFECFADDRRGREATDSPVAGFSTGAAAALLLFLKVSCFFLVGPLVLASWWIRGIRPRHLFGMAAGFVAVSAAMLAYLEFDVAAVIADWKMAAGARSQSLTAAVVIPRLVRTLPTVALALWLGWRASSLDSDPKGARRLHFLVAALAIVVVDLGSLASNQQLKQIPLTAALGLLAAQLALDARARGRIPETATPPMLILCASAVLFLFQFVLDVGGLATGLRLKADPGDLSAVPRFTPDRIKDWILYPPVFDPNDTGAYFVPYINSGVEILRANQQPGETVLTMDMGNPFPYLLDQPPPRGGIVTVAYRYTLSDDFHPSADEYFGQADLVLVPKKQANQKEYFDGFYRIYEADLKQRYRVVAETDLWYLYRRR